MSDPSYKKPGWAIVTVPMDPALHRRLRIYCATEGRSIKWTATEAIKRFLNSEDTLKRLGCVEDGTPAKAQGTTQP